MKQAHTVLCYVIRYRSDTHKMRNYFSNSLNYHFFLGNKTLDYRTQPGLFYTNSNFPDGLR